jgi:hypothetical protein
MLAVRGKLSIMEGYAAVSIFTMALAAVLSVIAFISSKSKGKLRLFNKQIRLF